MLSITGAALVSVKEEATVQKMMPPNPVPISQLTQETGVSDVTLYKWRKQYRERGFAVPADDTNPDNWKT